MIGVELAGEHQHTLARLQALSVDLQTKVVGSGLTAAAKPVKAALKGLAPAGRTGRLKKSISQNRISDRAATRLGLFEEQEDLTLAGTVGVLLGPNRRVDGRLRASIAQLLETGTRPHRIRPKSPRGILKLRGGMFARSVMHPGIKAIGFMRRAFDSTASEVEDRFFEGMSRRLDKLTEQG